MKTGELIRYSRKLIKGRRAGLLLVCLLPLCGRLTLHTAETAVYCLMLYAGRRPAELFTGDTAFLTAAVFAALRCILCAPLDCAAAHRLREAADGKKVFTPVTDLLSRGRFLRRSTAAAVIHRIVSGLALAPALLSAGMTYTLFSRGGDTEEVFALLHSSVLTALLIWWWLKVKTGMAAVPFLMADSPDTSALRLTIRSMKMLRGRKHILVFLGLRYALPGLLLFPLPEAGTAAALSISIFLREDEYRRQREISVTAAAKKTA